ncbi:tubulin beta chain [Pelomyxa schiedti]|nr:tubulin beta chain [Pelomyxa schiedti]
MRETCGTGRRVPRCVFVDIGCGPGDVVDGVENLVDPSNVICSPQGCGSNWAVGHYVTGAEMLDEVMDSIRLECERCDCMDGFQLAHSLSGGTGSGLGTLILGALREEYPDRMFCTFSVFPSPVPDVPLAPYNSILSMFRLDEDSDLTFCLDNDSLLKISAPTLKHPPTYKDLNHLVSGVMSGITASHRFPGELNQDIRKLAVNMVPFPHMHFLLCGVSPMGDCSETTPLDEDILTKNIFASCDARSGKHIATSLIFRGEFHAMEVENQLSRLRSKSSAQFFNAANRESILCSLQTQGFLALVYHARNGRDGIH